MQPSPDTFFSSLPGPENKLVVIYGPPSGHKTVIGDIVAENLRQAGISSHHFDTGRLFRLTAREAISTIPKQTDPSALQDYLVNLPPEIICEILGRIKIILNGSTYSMFFDGNPIDPLSLRDLSIGGAAGFLGHNERAQRLVAEYVINLFATVFCVGLNAPYFVILDGRRKTLEYYLKEAPANTLKIIPFFVRRPVSAARIISAIENPFSQVPDPQLPLEKQAVIEEIDDYLEKRVRRDAENATPHPLTIFVERREYNGLNYAQAQREILQESKDIGKKITDLLLHLHVGNPLSSFPAIRVRQVGIFETYYLELNHSNPQNDSLLIRR